NNTRVVFGATIAIGKDNFESIIGDRLIFVDKSMLIKEFIKSSDFISLILRPRHFGKSTNLSILNHFFKNLTPETWDEMTTLLRNASIIKDIIELQMIFLKAWFHHIEGKSNDKNIAKAMLVGILWIAKSRFLSRLNNLIVYPLYQESQFHLYADKFEFTPDEVELLLPKHEDLKTNKKASTSFKETVKKLLKGEYIASIEIQDDLQYLYLDQYQDLAICTLLYYAEYLTMNSEKHLVFPNIENGINGKNAENVYHTFCLGMFIVAYDQGYIIYSNCEACIGRYDVKIVSKSGVGKIAIIIEFKIVHDNKSLNNMAHKELCQIEKKHEVKRLLEIGIAFEGKKACVVGHLLHRTEDREWIKSL
ncbi:10533_t:CDS:2, partial [Dentiscutata heterogama]